VRLQPPPNQVSSLHTPTYDAPAPGATTRWRVQPTQPVQACLLHTCAHLGAPAASALARAAPPPPPHDAVTERPGLCPAPPSPVFTTSCLRLLRAARRSAPTNAANYNDRLHLCARACQHHNEHHALRSRPRHRSAPSAVTVHRFSGCLRHARTHTHKQTRSTRPPHSLCQSTALITWRRNCCVVAVLRCSR
jgi:hypothetical protein